MTFRLRRLTTADLSRLRQFLVEHWGSEELIAHGHIYHPEQLDGFVIEDENEWVGLLTFFIKDHECEVVSLDSLREGHGIGTQLMDKAIQEARARGCHRLFLITTNDNLHALGFYQKRGLELVAVYRGAVNKSRKRKPSIPLVGMDGIPLRDEIELEIRF
jgi:GNAT superfamily N-acetyltransferase